MTRIRTLLLTALTLLVLSLSAQSLPDGVYQSHAALLSLTPDYNWAGIAGEMVRIEEKRSLKIEGYANQAAPEAPLPYAVVLHGLPYLHIPAATPRNFEEFAGLHDTLALSRVSYDTTIQTRQLMRAYNPRNGRPFREGWVEREKVVRLERIYDLRSGKLYPFDLETVRRLCASDRDLRAALSQTTAGETDKLTRALRIYSKRNPLPLPLTDPNR